MNIIIQGFGVVGTTLYEALKILGNTHFGIHDPYKGFVVSPNSDRMNKADVLFYCVNEKDGRITDGSLLEKMVGKLVIIKTTLNVGETELMQSILPGVKIVYMPEFLREDYMLDDLLHPDHLVYGAVEQEYSEAANEIFIGLSGVRYYVEPKEAELIKLVSNTYPLIKLAFFNQLYDLCIEKGISYEHVIAPQLKNKFNSGKYMEIFNKGGRGGGGKCLPKDLDILLQSDIGREILTGVKKVNDDLLAKHPKKR